MAMQTGIYSMQQMPGVRRPGTMGTLMPSRSSSFSASAGQDPVDFGKAVSESQKYADQLYGPMKNMPGYGSKAELDAAKDIRANRAMALMGMYLNNARQNYDARASSTGTGGGYSYGGGNSGGGMSAGGIQSFLSDNDYNKFGIPQGGSATAGSGGASGAPQGSSTSTHISVRNPFWNQQGLNDNDFDWRLNEQGGQQQWELVRRPPQQQQQQQTPTPAELGINAGIFGI